jgi:hypothetical protein
MMGGRAQVGTSATTALGCLASGGVAVTIGTIGTAAIPTIGITITGITITTTAITTGITITTTAAVTKAVDIKGASIIKSFPRRPLALVF